MIAPSFADIFKSNSFRCGLLPVELPEPSVRHLIAAALSEPGIRVTVDLEHQLVSLPQAPGSRPPGAEGSGWATSFTLDPFFRECLLNGWDEVALTLRQAPEITRYEAVRPAWLPLTR